MESKVVKISSIKMNKENPRVIRDEKFNKIVKSINEFPEMLKIRPIVVNDDMVVLGGNMRLRACKEAGLKEVPIIVASELTEEQQKEFIIKDNVAYGEWDWDILANTWDENQLTDWGLDVWKQAADIDYSVLDEEDLSGDLDDKVKNIKKSIQIEFESEDYEIAQELVKSHRDKGHYIGALLIEKLKESVETDV
jgi:ParB-like chromosome segregation protein Spo0J